MGRRIDYKEGQQVGQCAYIKELPKTSYGKRKALFKCQCGEDFEALIQNVTREFVTNCGCIKYAHMRTHGLTKHPVYKMWQRTKRRCFDKKHISYLNYGGRGITMYKSWISNFQLYYDYVISLPNYGTPSLTIDRIDNNGDYVPGNLRWATRTEQNQNRRKENLGHKNGFNFRKNEVPNGRKLVW